MLFSFLFHNIPLYGSGVNKLSFLVTKTSDNEIETFAPRYNPLGINE